MKFSIVETKRVGRLQLPFLDTGLTKQVFPVLPSCQVFNHESRSDCYRISISLQHLGDRMEELHLNLNPKVLCIGKHFSKDGLSLKPWDTTKLDYDFLAFDEISQVALILRYGSCTRQFRISLVPER